MTSRNSLSTFTLASVLLLPLPALANEFDLRVSDDTVQLNLSSTKQNASVFYGGGYLYKDGKDQDKSVNLVNADFHAIGRTALANMPTTAGLGVQVNHADQGPLNATAIGIGGILSVTIPDAPGLSVETQAHYAPRVLAFQDSTYFTRAHIQLNYRIIKSADLAAGYRYISTGIENAKRYTFESGAYLGIRIIF